MVTLDKVVILGCFFDKKMLADLINKNNKIKVNIQKPKTKFKENIMRKKIYLSNTIVKIKLENK